MDYIDELTNALRQSYNNTLGFEEIAKRILYRLQDKGLTLQEKDTSSTVTVTAVGTSLTITVNK